jgi:hypothetical protein
MSKKSKQDKHPSGLPWERWNWPFKTTDEKVLAAQWFRKEQRNEKRKQLDNFEESPF